MNLSDFRESISGADAALKMIGSNSIRAVGGLVSPRKICRTTPIFIPGNALLQYFLFSKALGVRKGFTGKYHIFKICFVNLLKLYQYVPPSHFNFKTIRQAK